MLGLTLRGLLARKVRLLLSGLAVVLGVAFTSGTLVLTDTMTRVFDDLFATATAGVDVVVRGQHPLGSGAYEEPPGVPAEVLDAVRRVEGVASAAGTVTTYAQLVTPDGDPVTAGGAPTLGVDASFSDLSPLRLREGEAPRGLGEVAVDVVTAERVGLEVGDRVSVLTRGPVRKAVITGLVGFGEGDGLGGAPLVAFDPAVVREALAMNGRWTEVVAAAEEGLTEEALRDRVAEVLPDGVEAVTGAQSSADSADDVTTGIGFFRTALLVFAGVSLFVGAFLIFNTFSMLVAQRSRELALLRALGASRRQVTGSVLLEAVVVGLVSGVLGFGLGLGVAVGLRAVFGAIGLTLPDGPTVVLPRTFVVSLVVGVGVTAVAALLPARRASAVAPVEAMRESGPAEPRSLRRRGISAAVLALVSGGSLAYGLTQGELPAVGLGAATGFLAVCTGSPFLARPVVSLLGIPFDRTPAGRLGLRNALRSPRRTAATASALTIGVGLVAAVSVFAASLQTGLTAAVEGGSKSDLLVVGDGTWAGFGDEVVTAVRGVEGVAVAAGARGAQARIAGGLRNVQGMDPEALDDVLRVDVVEGDLGRLRDGLALDAGTAEDLGLSAGDVVDVELAVGGRQRLPVVAVYEGNELADDFLLDAARVKAGSPSSQNFQVDVVLADDADAGAVRAGIERALADRPNLVVRDRGELLEQARGQIDQLLGLIGVLLVLSVVIALLGVVNTLALSVLERVRELGLLRAVGMQRRQLKRSIRVESVLTCVYGAVLGVVVGTGLGWALVRPLQDEGPLEFTVPYARLATMVVVAALAGVVAAALPARRAARLDVLSAISTA